MPRRVGKLDVALLGTALKVLKQAVDRAKGQSVATLDVQLALFVVHRYLRDRDLVARFWQRARQSNRSVNESIAEPLAAIETGLVKQGWIAPAVLLDQPQIWQWDSPPPPGWLAPPWRPREVAKDEQQE